MERQIRRRGVDISERCDKIEFILHGEYGRNLVEGVEKFKYMNQPLDQTDND